MHTTLARHYNSQCKPVAQPHKKEKLYSEKRRFSHLLISSPLLVDASGSQALEERKKKSREVKA